MDIDKLAERIMSRIEEDRCIHKSSLVEEIQKALAPKKWDQPQPAMMDDCTAISSIDALVAMREAVVASQSLTTVTYDAERLTYVFPDGTTHTVHARAVPPLGLLASIHEAS